jgi:hypothetical protein
MNAFSVTIIILAREKQKKILSFSRIRLQTIFQSNYSFQPNSSTDYLSVDRINLFGQTHLQTSPQDILFKKEEENMKNNMVIQNCDNPCDTCVDV